MTVPRTVRALPLLLLVSWGSVAVVGAQPDVLKAQFAEAKQAYEQFKYDEALAKLDPFIASIERQVPRDRDATDLLVAAYEYRARTRLQKGLTDGADADFVALLRIAPGYSLTPPVSNPIKRAFDERKKTTVGKFQLLLTAPNDATYELDGAPFEPAAGQIPIAAGSHALSGRRPGYRPASQAFNVTAGALIEVVLTLERIAATVSLTTSPAGVEVLLDGVPKGRTEAGPPPQRWDEMVAKAGLQPGAVSKPLVLDDLGPGSHILSFSRECHVGFDLTAEITTLTDKVLGPVKLEPAVASVWVESQPPAATIWLDNKEQGQAPKQLDGICEGRHRLEMRSLWGRYVDDLTLKTGDKLTIQGSLKPAVALLSATGYSKDYRGEDPRLDVGRRLADAKHITFFAPPSDEVATALNAEDRLSPGWLAFDPWGRRTGAIAANIEPPARRDIGARLAQKFEVQGVGEMAAPSAGDKTERVLTILASGSAVPDVLELSMDDLESFREAIARLDRVPDTHRPSAGVTVADVLDVTGAVVLSVDPASKSGLSPGDVITKVAGQPLKSGSTFAAVVAKQKQGDSLPVEVQAKGGAVKSATLGITTVPRLVNMKDQSLLFNNLAIVLRSRIARAGANPDQIDRLNLAVAYMRLGNYAEARTQLTQVKLDPGPGVSGGTVHYLLGLCHEQLGPRAEAEREWRLAEQDSESLLTEDGPFIQELAKEKLEKLKK